MASSMNDCETGFEVHSLLNRQVVSFQGNKQRGAYRWYKFKEAFSASLVHFLLERYGTASGRLLDPFAGSGTALFAASEHGLDADGIELLPLGWMLVQVRQCLESDFSRQDFDTLEKWRDSQPWRTTQSSLPLPCLRITDGAYPERTASAIGRYLHALQSENDKVRLVLQFALLCVLESVSYTRKDGQYLRWDYRAGRRQGKKRFDKGSLPEFDAAISGKLNEIIRDMVDSQPYLWPGYRQRRGQVNLFRGSCLRILPTLATASYDAIVTSPPYCNRYDYTRTYALELAILGVDERRLTELRQDMLSCTVENRKKDLLSINPSWDEALAIAQKQALLQVILEYLDGQKSLRKLNNDGIPRMVRGYFQEMSCVIAECSRVLKPGGLLAMVNDNVRYAGVSVSVDMILSDIAEGLGFQVEHILVLPNGKGNSSQQMGEHGREPLRKCVYAWRKG